MGEWREIELADLCARVTSGGTPSRSHPEYYTTHPQGHFWVKSSELRNGYIGATKERVSDLGLQESAAKLLPPGTVLVAMYGATAGKVGLLRVEAALNQAICALVPDEGRTDSVFLFHALRSQYENLVGKAAGAAQQNLNAGTIKSFRLALPDVTTQKRIAAVLSAFDEMIEINERRIELLEDLARSLYREWFVRFRFPGCDQTMLVDSDLGQIPQGWTVCQFGDVANVNKETLKVTEIPNPFQYLDISAVGVGTLGVLSDMASTEAPGRARRRVSDGDVVWATVRPNRGAHAQIHDPPPGLVASTGLAVLSPVAIPSSFLFEYAASEGFGRYLVSRASGSAYPAVRPKDFREAPILIPPPLLLGRFDQIVEPLLRCRSSLRHQLHRLAATRDLLLPRLVTGQLDVSDIDLGVLTPSEVE